MTTLLAATTSLCGGGLPGNVASILHGFQPASSFCAAKFPIPTFTTTLTAPTFTITATAPTLTIVTTAATQSTTQTDATISFISTGTETDTSTVTITTTLSPTMKRRDEPAAKLEKRVTAALRPGSTPSSHVKRSPPSAASNSAMSKYFSAITALEKSFVAAVCTCLETQPIKSVTTTPSYTMTPAPLATSLVTQTNTAHTTDSTTTTTSTTTATTTTVIATSTPAVPCTGTGGCQNFPGGSFLTQCDSFIEPFGDNPSSTITESSGAACLSACIADAACNIFQFTPTGYGPSGSCALYDGIIANLNFEGVAGDYAGYYQAGSC